MNIPIFSHTTETAIQMTEVTLVSPQNMGIPKVCKSVHQFWLYHWLGRKSIYWRSGIRNWIWEERNSESRRKETRDESRVIFEYRRVLSQPIVHVFSGVVFFDGTAGIWLVHSVPKFPPPDHYSYPESGMDYGQTMLCMTFKYAELSKIGEI